MTVQLARLFRQGVVRPLDSKARDELVTFFLSKPVRCEWLPIIDDALFTSIWKSGLLQAIGQACNEHFSDYEEVLLRPESLEKAINAVKEFIDSARDDATMEFAISLRALLTEARRSNMPVMFIL